MLNRQDFIGVNMKRSAYVPLVPEHASALNEVRLYSREGGIRDPRATANHILVLLVASLALAGCNTAQVLTFNYAVQTVPDASVLLTSVQNGQTTITNLLSQNPCNFTANFASPTPPRVFTNGTPGQTGFNVNIVSTAPVNLSTTNPQSCTALQELEINIGGQSQALALG